MSHLSRRLHAHRRRRGRGISALLVNGDVGPRSVVSYFAIPVLFGNTIGGTALFALVSHARMMQMMKAI